MRHEVVIRQTFAGGNYALLNNDLDPNPVSIICQLKQPVPGLSDDRDVLYRKYGQTKI